MWLWALLPLSFSVIGSVGVWTVCAVGVANGAVNLTWGIPYISDCAAKPPQSCLFAQTCSIINVLALMIAVIRFHQVRDYGYNGKANIASVFFGFLSPIGLSVTSNFQAPVAFDVHFLGAFVAFFSSLLYFWMQLYLTYQGLPYKERNWVGPIRAICCIVCTIMLSGMAVIKSNNGNAACEWVFVMLVFFLYGLFVTEFRHIDCCFLTVRMSPLKNDCSSPPSVHINSFAVNAF